MKLLLQRTQGRSTFGKPIFRMMAKMELTDEEVALVERYDFAGYEIIPADEPGLIRNAVLIGLGAAVIAWFLFSSLGGLGSFLQLAAAVGAGWFYYDRMRERIFVRDFIHGRYFDCPSVLDLAKKEAFLQYSATLFRQLMETAKSWGDFEITDIPPLPPEEAKQLVIRKL